MSADGAPSDPRPAARSGRFVRPAIALLVMTVLASCSQKPGYSMDPWVRLLLVSLFSVCALLFVGLFLWVAFVVPVRLLNILAQQEGVTSELGLSTSRSLLALGAFVALVLLPVLTLGERVPSPGLSELPSCWIAFMGPALFVRYWVPPRQGRFSTLRVTLLTLTGFTAAGWLDILA